MNYGNSAKKKKKTVIYWIVGSLLIIALIIGAVYYVSQKDNKKQSQKREKEHKSVDIQQLQTQLNSVKSELDKSNTNQKSQLESKLTEIENKVKNLSSPDKPTIKKLEEEIKEIKEKLEENKPDKDKPNKNDNPKDKPGDSPKTPNDNKWEYVVTKIDNNTYKYHITFEGSKVDFSDFISSLAYVDNGIKMNRKFFETFQGALKDANSKFPAYFWKCPPISTKTLNKDFEFVVIKSEALNNITQDYSSFDDYLGKIHGKDKPSVISFPNNRNPSDAILVIPAFKLKDKKMLDYKNISQFTKNALDEQQQELWKEVANKLEEQLRDGRPRWLNTHGLGVHYLHVRIDTSNRYY